MGRCFRRRSLLCAVWLLSGWLGHDLRAAEPVEIPQSWRGVLLAGGAKLRLRFDISRAVEGRLRCDLISIDQGNVRIQMDTCEIADGRLICSSKRLGIVLDGEYQPGDQEIAGTFTQAGQSFPLKLEATPPPPPRKQVETWYGTMKAGERVFDFQFRVFADAEEKRSVELDSLSEGLGGLPVTPTFSGDEVTFEIVLTKARFEGRYNAERNKIAGHWIQNGGRFELVLRRVAVAETKSILPPARPQTPRGPFPYRIEEVEFAGASEEVRLAGTLTLPRTGGPFPVAVLITGSGPQDRDETIMEHKPFLVIADHLTRQGVAVLRYDERGVGASTGNFAQANSQDFAADVDAAVAYLLSRREIDPGQVGLIGHSEGGYIAPMVAARRDDVAWIVLLAGTGVPGDQILLNQAERIARAAGAPAADISLNRRLQQALFGAIRSGAKQPEVVAAFDRFVATLQPEEQQHAVVAGSRGEIARLLEPWFRFFLTYDPGEALARVRCRVLVLNGDKDLQVDPDLNLPAIRAALVGGGNNDYEMHRLPDLNHLFQKCKTGLPGEYRQIEQTIDPAVLQVISKWILRR
ncbi:MAG: alpha/beta hydrolase [Planctomycetota bacterium]|nr:alpha/beta hydrolase [Planctomycetota bacterium]